jgi:hypothetical protein
VNPITFYQVAAILGSVAVAIWLPEFWYRSSRSAGVVALTGILVFYLCLQLGVVCSQ